MHAPLRIVFGFLALLPAFCSFSSGAEPASAEDQKFFETKIRPVLVKHCYECHSADSQELGGNLRLDSRAAVLQGGQSGPALVAGQPDKSLIVQALRYEGDLAMPPEEPLPEPVIRDFVRWIERGAADPRVAMPSEAPEPAEVSQEESLWSLQPRRVVAPPAVQGSDWPRDPLDHFILARIEAAGLSPTHDAPPRVLARRLYFDLIGLPPGLRDIERFETEYAREPAGAVERLVERLLASPLFGQRWGRHWLDVARYGESNGDDGLGRNATFPHAWRYRDYVIDALNRDVPYNRFLLEQIAGDLLPAESARQRNRQLVATGFLAIGSKPAKAMNNNFHMDIVDDQINVVSTGILGLSVACARCHDHKHDPIPTRDYYALAGIFASTETLYGLAANEGLTAPPTELHELKSVWDPNGATASPNDPSLHLPDAYAAEVRKLQPALHASLATPPESLTVESDVSYSDQEYAAVKSAALHGQLSASGDSYSVSFWFRNTLKNNGRPITAYLFSRAPRDDKQLPGDHIGIGGTHDKARTGKLFIFSGGEVKQSLAGDTVIPPGSWNHVVLIRRGTQVRVFLNGGKQPEIEGQLPPAFGDNRDFCLASRSDNFAPLEGNLAEFSLFERPLEDRETTELYAASGRPPAPRTLGLAMGVRDKQKPADTKIHINGESGKLGPVVPRGFLTAIGDDLPAAASDSGISDYTIPPGNSGRLQLAAWLTHPDHPLTARVIVNRVWLHLFGQGLVPTPDDFGVYGTPPTHPELLDYLADRFVREGWSLKRLIRALVLSRTYQLASRCDEQLARVDPDNRLHARHSRRRLDAESLRDSMLQASGQLDLSPGQGSVIQELDTLINWPPGEATDLHEPSRHRSVYLCMLRHAPPPELAAFDLPRGVDVAGQRTETTLPTQALFLFNNAFVVEQSDALAARVLSAEAWDDERRVVEIFHRVLQRDPTSAEQQQALDLVQGLAESPGEPEEREHQRRRAWASLCQALLMTNEFRYID